MDYKLHTQSCIIVWFVFISYFPMFAIATNLLLKVLKTTT